MNGEVAGVGGLRWREACWRSGCGESGGERVAFGWIERADHVDEREFECGHSSSSDPQMSSMNWSSMTLMMASAAGERAS